LALLHGFFDTSADLLIDGPEPESWVLFIIRERAHPIAREASPRVFGWRDFRGRRLDLVRRALGYYVAAAVGGRVPEEGRA
jgi:hypothetical protein